MPFPRASNALTRFTVLDLTRVRAGPTCARQLADWGANVIKVEAPSDGEEPMGGPREGSDFQNLHRNKRSMTLDLKAPAGLAAFKRLVKKADVLIENFRPDVKKRLGIDYKTLSKINPRLVFASISGFGQDGPYADRPGFDQIAQGMGGLMSITGLPGQGPVRVGIPVADLSAGLFAALGIFVALLERETSGKGQAIETSLLQAQIFMLDFQASRFLVEVRWRGRPATIIRPASRPVCSKRATVSSISPRLAAKCGSGSAPRWGPRRWRRIRTIGLRRRARKIAMHLTPRSKTICKAAPAPNGWRSSMRPAYRAGRSIRSIRCSPIRKCGTSALRKASAGKASRRCVSSASRCRCRARPRA